MKDRHLEPDNPPEPGNNTPRCCCQRGPVSEEKPWWVEYLEEKRRQDQDAAREYQKQVLDYIHNTSSGPQFPHIPIPIPVPVPQPPPPQQHPIPGGGCTRVKIPYEDWVQRYQHQHSNYAVPLALDHKPRRRQRDRRSSHYRPRQDSDIDDSQTTRHRGDDVILTTTTTTAAVPNIQVPADMSPVQTPAQQLPSLGSEVIVVLAILFVIAGGVMVVHRLTKKSELHM